MSRSITRRSRGFTLVELLVVVSILAVLSSISIILYQDVAASSRGTKIVADLRTIDWAITAARFKGIDSPGQADLVPEYIVQWPSPPAGYAIIEGGSRFSVPATPYSITSLRATINSKTIEQVLTDKSI